MATCGLDEAGRGPLAGPVTAGCAVLPPDFPLDVLGDSKALTARRREKAFALIQERAFWGLGWADAAEIDTVNILQASLLAMSRAYQDLVARFPQAVIDDAIVDGLHCPALPVPCRALVKADALVPAVSAASILAKVARDRFMDEADARDPRYGFRVHKGYPTLAHRRALVVHGPGPLHRISFAWKRPAERA
jgi:ribonuclease HII